MRCAFVLVRKSNTIDKNEISEFNRSAEWLPSGAYDYRYVRNRRRGFSDRGARYIDKSMIIMIICTGHIGTLSGTTEVIFFNFVQEAAL